MSNPGLKSGIELIKLGTLIQRVPLQGIRSACIILIILLTIPKLVYPDNKVKNIVIFFSLDATVPGYQSFIEGFRSSFYEQIDEPYNLLIEYLDVGRFPDIEHAQKVVNVYNQRFKETKIDLIITVAPGTYELLKKLGLEALSTSQVINVKLENLSGPPETDTPDSSMLVIHMKLNVRKSLNTAFNLFPDRKNVFVLSGISPTDLYFMSAARKAATWFRDSHNFTFISGLPIDSALKVLSDIPANSLFVISSYLMDSRNMPISSSLFISALSIQNKAPVFTLSDNFIRRGGVGGYVFSFYKVGNETRKAAFEILHGKPIKDIVVDEDGFYQHMYDWKQLSRWNLLHTGLIPSDSIFYSREVDFFTEYFWQILIFLIFVILETFLIAYLYRTTHRQKEIMRQKSETEILHLELIREERLMRMAELTASLSHELNQPLTAILYSAQAGNRFLESGKLDTPRAKEIFDNIIEADKRAGSILSSLRSMMKSETREKETINIREVIQDTINIYHSEAVEQNIQIRYSQPDKPVMVSGDRIQLQQVVLNLLSNAARAMKDTVSEKKITEISQLVNHGSVTVSIRDYGTGISDEIKDKLFKPFITTHRSGLGIGLSISRSIIERHGGEISASNKEGGGAEFSFTLKLAEDE